MNRTVNIKIMFYIKIIYAILAVCSINRQVITMKGDVPFTFTLNPKLLKQLKAKAKNDSVTIAGLLRTIIARECAKPEIAK